MADHRAVRVLWLAALAGCGDNASPTFECNGTTGLVAPLVPCSPAHPCGDVTTPFQVPECLTHKNYRAPFDDSPPRMWTDAVTGDQRAACVFRPPGAGDRPLVLWFHGAHGIVGAPPAASLLYDETSLRAKATTFDLENDPSRLGFVVVADEGATLDNPNSIAGGGATRRDIYYRDLASPSTNPDIRNADRLIDELVAEGGIDTRRIYVIGWSNGGLFAQEYGVARHATATPGGHRVAAAVAYAGPDPFENLSATQSPSCAYTPLPATDLPIDVVHRDCDSNAPCNAAQQAFFALPPGYDLTGWIATLRATMGDRNVIETMFDAAAMPTTTCAPVSACTHELGLANHSHWPDGVTDASGIDHELDMLAFLRDHPL